MQKKAGDNMALKKAITDTKGITTEYHMIDGIQVMADRIEVTFKSYISEEYREKEKAITDNLLIKADLEKQLLEASVAEEPDEELIEALNQQIASLDTEQKDCSVGTMRYRIPFDKEKNISFKDIYKWLRKEATFADAVDC